MPSTKLKPLDKQTPVVTGPRSGHALPRARSDVRFIVRRIRRVHDNMDKGTSQTLAGHRQIALSTGPSSGIVPEAVAAR